MATSRTSRSERFLSAVSAYPEILVVSHDNPDPDAIAAGWAIQWLISEKLGKPARLIGGGEIVRAENRHMLKLLQDELLSRWLIACGIDHQRGRHLIARQEIVENL